MSITVLAGLTLIAQSMVHVPASDMNPSSSSGASFSTASSDSAAEATATQRGRVVSAPHDGFDLGSGLVAQRIAEDLRWGLVIAQEYRQTSSRRWFDVNRPTQRRWISGVGFDSDRTRSQRAREIYEAYQSRIQAAAEVAQGSTIRFLLEIHAHERRVVVGGVRVPLMVIEMASNGFTAAELREMQQRYNALVSQLPSGARVPLAIDDIDSRYDYRGEEIRFYFRATGARNEGSMRRSQARRSLHMELPPLVVAVPELRRFYSQVIAEMVRPYSATSSGISGAVAGN